MSDRKRKLFKRIYEITHKLSGLTNKEVADIIMDDDNGFGYTHSSIAKTYVHQAKGCEGDLDKLPEYINATNPTTREIDSNADDLDQRIIAVDNSGNVLGPTVIVGDGENEEEVKRSIVNQIKAGFSREGANMTAAQVVKALGISKELFNKVKRHYGITKDSDPSAIHYFENEGRESVTAEAVSSIIDKYSSLHGESVTGMVRSLKKEFYDIGANKRRLELLSKELIELLTHTDWFKWERPIATQQQISEEITVFITDLHLGMKGKFFSYEVAANKLAYVQQVINSYAAAGLRVNVVCLGDLLHTVSGENHQGTWKDIEEGAFGAQAIIKPATMLIEFLGGIKNLNYFGMVGGNHDRLSSANTDDLEDGGAELVTKMVEYALPWLNVEFAHDIIVKDVGRLRHVCQHGDLRADKATAKDKYIEFGSSDLFNVFNTGHLHHYNIGGKQQGSNYLAVGHTSFCPPDDYAERGGYNNAFPGFTIIAEQDGKPDIRLVPLVYKQIR